MDTTNALERLATITTRGLLPVEAVAEALMERLYRDLI